MDHEQLARRAAKGDVSAFVELTRRFQHFAFGSALALVHDFQQAEDVVQEAFVAAWKALPTLAEPAGVSGLAPRHRPPSCLPGAAAKAIACGAADRGRGTAER